MWQSASGTSGDTIMAYGLKASLKAVLLLGILAAPSLDASAKGFKVLYAFKGDPTDGVNPAAAPTFDRSGNLFGNTVHGGGCTLVFTGCGTVYLLEPDGTEAVLYYFTGETDGSLPYSTLLLKDNTLYGTASETQSTHGTVFALPIGGPFHVVHDFSGSPDDGAMPRSALFFKNGKLFGTTVLGGTGDAGAIFEIENGSHESLLYSFDVAKGQNPYATLVGGPHGALFGTTWAGGADGCGTVFTLSAKGKYKVLHEFPCTGSDGSRPISGLLLASDGNFYGTTTTGGGEGCGGLGCGTIYRVTPNGNESVVYSFAGGSDGSQPYAALVEGAPGNLYGTTREGGGGTLCPTAGCGTVFKFKIGGSETLLYAFTGGSDGGNPFAGLTVHRHNLYGAAFGGGLGYGTVFKLKE